MKELRLNSKLLFLLMGLFFMTCQSDAEKGPSTQDRLVGKWEIIEAYRNGTLAESLEDLYFEFYGDGNLKTNVLGSSMQTAYTVEGEKILQDGGERGVPVEYLINELTDTTLTLTTTLRRYNFKFDLGRVVEVE